MKLYLPKRVLFGLFAAMAIIAGLVTFTYIGTCKLAEHDRRIALSNNVLYHAGQISAWMPDWESDSDVPEKDSIIVFNHLHALQELSMADAHRNSQVLKLKEFISQRFKITPAVKAARNKNLGDARSALHENRSALVREGIRQSLRTIQQEEKKLLEQQSLLNYQDKRSFVYWAAGLFASAAMVFTYIFISVWSILKDRARQERILKRQLNEIRDVYDHAPCGYHSLNDSGVFEDINETLAGWLQYEKKELIGRLRFQDIITPESATKFQRNFPMFKMQGFIHDIEFDAVRKDNTTFPVIVNATAVYDKKGSFLKSRSTVFDYTDRKKAEEKIQLLNRELEAFTYSVSHDLRAPLRSIDGYTRILMEDHVRDLEEEGRRVLGIVAKNANKMGQLIDGLLSFSRAGRKELSRTTFNMNNLVKGIWTELRAIESTREIEHTIDDLGDTFADPVLLRQVWINLLSNALKYTRKEKVAKITITARLSQNETVYSIRDNGTGFNMEYKHTLFEVFQRLHRAQDFEGTGVGLAIVHRIITRHGGSVWAEGKTDEGAVFYFSLPHESTI